MKKLIIAVVLLIIILPACNKDDQLQQWRGIGTIEKADNSNDEFIINLDGGEKLIPNGVIANNTYDNQDRIIVTYAITNELGNNEYEVDLYDIDRILTKDIIQLTELNQDTIGNDPVFTNEENIWIKDNYINFIFSYYGGFKTHLINLVKLSENTHTDDGKLILEFRHNDHDDYSSSLYNGVVSFDLESLKEDGLETIEFVVKIDLYEDSTLEWEGSYNFNSNLKSNKNFGLKNKFIQGSSVNLK